VDEKCRCGCDATQRVKWINGAITGKWMYGTTEATYMCDHCLAELVRTTDKRYEVKPIKRRRREVVTPNPDQQQWVFDV
jgi:hypothetical protein